MENLLIGLYVAVPVIALVANRFGKWVTRETLREDAGAALFFLSVWPVTLLFLAVVFLPEYLLPKGDK